MPTRWVLDRIASSMFRAAGIAQWVDPITFAIALGFRVERAAMQGALLVGRTIYCDSNSDKYVTHTRVLTELARAELIARQLPSDDTSARQLRARIIAGGLRRSLLLVVNGGSASESVASLPDHPALPGTA